jgi:hypothetical protein
VDTAVKIELFEPEADAERVDELTQLLREELLQLDVDSAEPVPGGPAPEGSKGLELATIGALLVTLRSSAELAERVVSVVRSWLRRGSSPARAVRLTVEGRTLELSAATDAQQQQLVEEFVRAMAKN